MIQPIALLASFSSLVTKGLGVDSNSGPSEHFLSLLLMSVLLGVALPDIDSDIFIGGGGGYGTNHSPLNSNVI